ncbi:hypothetical protein PFLG_03094 [Plasmodium falciparum RAJ116]|uniref:Uncharacterized protein n=1 Tax=Plasmodium falciparum RAJ116 TaxID=580058 RepID=A0A0L0D0K9_PLAFA|nr:hypothetical protein PFLG_03094 [Plasmodium falciparum RAJ116]
MSNYYINEAYSSNLKSEKVRRKLRIHIYPIYKDGQREVEFPFKYKSLQIRIKFIIMLVHQHLLLIIHGMF